MSTQKFKTMAEVKELNKLNGFHFFDKVTVRFFDSQIETSLLKGEYFITSEKKCFSDNDRRYTIRKVRENGSIDTIGEFNGFISLEQAKEVLRIHAINNRS